MLSNTKIAIFRALQHNETGLQRVIRAFSTSQPPRILPGPHSLSNHIRISENKSIIHKSSNFYGFGRFGFVQLRELSEKIDAGLEESIKKTINENPVVVYSKTYCPFSSEVKFLFKRLDVDAHIIELDQLGDEGSEILKVLKRLTGIHTVPNVFIGGKHIGGSTDTLKLYKEGELEDLLAEAES